MNKQLFIVDSFFKDGKKHHTRRMESPYDIVDEINLKYSQGKVLSIAQTSVCTFSVLYEGCKKTTVMVLGGKGYLEEIMGRLYCNCF